MADAPYEPRGVSQHFPGFPPSLLKEETRTRWYRPQHQAPGPDPSINELPDTSEHLDQAQPLPEIQKTYLSEPFDQPASRDDSHRQNIERRGSDMDRRFQEAEFNQAEGAHPSARAGPFAVADGLAGLASPGQFPGPFPADAQQDARGVTPPRGPEEHGPLELPGDVPPAFRLPSGKPEGGSVSARGREPTKAMADGASARGHEPTKATPGEASAHGNEPTKATPGEASAHGNEPTKATPGEASAHGNEPTKATPGEASARGNEPTKATTDKASTAPRSRSKSITAKTKNSPPIIAIFGLTGAGKSSFINTLSGQDVAVGHNLQSCTTQIQEVYCQVGGQPVLLVDTPGFDDTNRVDAAVLQEIATYLQVVHSDRAKLTGILYLHRISDNRMTGVAVKNLRLLRNLCGTSNLGHVSLTTTMWDATPLADGERREQELLSDPRFWGRLQADGATVRRYQNSKDDATSIVAELLERSPVVLQIQKELAKGDSLLDTTAGRSLNDELGKEEKKTRTEHTSITKDIKETSE